MKRFGAIFVLFLLAGAFFVPRAYAQTPVFNPMPNAESIGKIVNEAAQEGRSNKELYSLNTQAILAGGVVCMVTGCSDNQQSTFYYGKSAVAVISNTVAAMYDNPPANLALWIRDTGQSLGFIPKQAYAQGIGFTGLSGLLPLWKVFRNIAYLLLATVMIIIGFMVMLRRKIDPKTVVTVQNAIPKIVLALLLITFSYAIVGLMIDLMYLVIFFLVGIFNSANVLPDPAAAVKSFYPTNAQLFSQGGIIPNISNIFGWFVVGGGISNPTTIVYQALGLSPATGTAISLGSLILGIGVTAATAPLIGPWGLLLALPAGLTVVASLLVSLALLFLIIRLFIFFLGAYIQVLLSLIFAPIQLVFEAMPGSTAFSDWIKNLVANLIVFPIGAGAFMLSAVFANMANGNNAQLWTPPLTSLVPSSTRSFSALVALGILFIIPNVAGAIKEALKAKSAVPVGLGGIAGSLGQAGGIAFQGFQFYHSIEQTKLLREAATKNKSGA